MKLHAILQRLPVLFLNSVIYALPQLIAPRDRVVSTGVGAFPVNFHALTNLNPRGCLTPVLTAFYAASGMTGAVGNSSSSADAPSGASGASGGGDDDDDLAVGKEKAPSLIVRYITFHPELCYQVTKGLALVHQFSIATNVSGTEKFNNVAARILRQILGEPRIRQPLAVRLSELSPEEIRLRWNHILEGDRVERFEDDLLVAVKEYQRCEQALSGAKIFFGEKESPGDWARKVLELVPEKKRAPAFALSGMTLEDWWQEYDANEKLLQKGPLSASRTPLTHAIFRQIVPSLIRMHSAKSKLPEDDVADAINEGMQYLMTHRGNADVSIPLLKVIRLKSWRCVVDLARRIQKEHEEEVLLPQPSRLEQFAAPEIDITRYPIESHEIPMLLKGVSEAEAEVIFLHARGFTHEEIAQMLELAATNVRKRYSRGMEKIKQNLKGLQG